MAGAGLRDVRGLLGGGAALGAVSQPPPAAARAAPLRYVGNVGSGLDERSIGELLRRMEPLGVARPPLDPVPKMPKTPARLVTWIEPRLAVKVQFTERTRDGRLRHPRFLGLRDDKAATEVVRERGS